MILVDPVRRHPSGEWCHMVSDESVEELHEFAPGSGSSARRSRAPRDPITICARRHDRWP